MKNAKAGDFKAASAALHQGLLDTNYDTIQLAKQLFTLIDKQMVYSWADISDLPAAPISLKDSRFPHWSRSVEIDSLTLNSQEITAYLQRFKLADSDQLIWLFSPEFIQQVPALHKHYKPSTFEQAIPQWASQRYVYLPLWQWAILPILIALSYLCARLCSLTFRIISKKLISTRLQEYIPEIRTPLVVILTVVFLKILTSLILSLSGPILTLTQTTHAIAIILIVFWCFTRCFNLYVDNLQEKYISDHSGEKKALDTLDNKAQKNQLTHISVLRRTVIFIAVIITTYVFLVQFNLLDGMSSTLISSFGILSVILGIAAQATLGNIIAGLQIAISKPVRIGDALNYAGTWCYCEDITYTYIILKVWDDRRIIVPLKEFISESFENWTLIDSHLIKPVELYVDFTVDIDQLRQKFQELMTAHKLYDQRFKASVQAISSNENALCVRFLCSAATPIDAWKLQCDMRETMAKYVAQLEDGRYLPRTLVNNNIVKLPKTYN